MATTKKETPEKKTPPVRKTEAKPVKAAAKAPVAPKLDDSARVRVRSNQYGKMGFVNSRTRDYVEWSGINDVQDMSVGDIRDMKNNSSRFFAESWVCVESIEVPGCEDLSQETVYEALGLSKFLKNPVRPLDLGEIHTWDVSMIQEKVPNMPPNTKDNVAIALNSEIREGRLTDLSLIKAWEKELGRELDRG